jgi:hypothetical protein
LKIEENMKYLSLIAVIALAISSASLASAQDFSKSSKEYNRKAFQKVETQKDYEALPSSSEIAMACSKCKSVTLIQTKEKATKPGHGKVEETLTVDSCPGCGGKITTKAGSKETAFVHTCSKCGDESAYCCATKDGKKTEGM